MDYINRSCDLPKSENGGCLLSRSCDLPKKEILMAYVSRSHDPPKSKNGEQVGVLI